MFPQGVAALNARNDVWLQASVPGGQQLKQRAIIFSGKSLRCQPPIIILFGFTNKRRRWHVLVYLLLLGQRVQLLWVGSTEAQKVCYLLFWLEKEEEEERGDALEKHICSGRTRGDDFLLPCPHGSSPVCFLHRSVISIEGMYESKTQRNKFQTIKTQTVDYWGKIILWDEAPQFLHSNGP